MKMNRSFKYFICLVVIQYIFVIDYIFLNGHIQDPLLRNLLWVFILILFLPTNYSLVSEIILYFLYNLLTARLIILDILICFPTD